MQYGKMLIAIPTYNPKTLQVKEVNDEGNRSGNSDGWDVGFYRGRDGVQVPELQRLIGIL
jgi:hypothetical protein